MRNLLYFLLAAIVISFTGCNTDENTILENEQNSVETTNDNIILKASCHAFTIGVSTGFLSISTELYYCCPTSYCALGPLCPCFISGSDVYNFGGSQKLHLSDLLREHYEEYSSIEIIYIINSDTIEIDGRLWEIRKGEYEVGEEGYVDLELVPSA